MKNLTNENGLPPNWVIIPLAELFDTVIGGDWGKDVSHKEPDFELAYCIRGSEFKNWKEDKGKTASLRKVKKTSLQARKLQKGDILIEISGGGPEQPVGRTVVIDKTVLNFNSEVPKVCTNFLRLARPVKEIDAEFLNYYLKLFYASGEIVKYQGGSNNLRNLKFPDYITIKIPLPSLPEQHRIVSKIEELFTELDKGIEQLQTAQQQLNVYRQAVLKWAFEGKLTNENVKDGELPKGWKTKSIEEVANVSTGVTPLRTNKAFWENGNIPWITSGALNNLFVVKAEEFITETAFNETTLKLLPKHSLLVALYGEGKTRGKCSELLFETTTNQAIAGVVLKNEFKNCRKYLKWFLIKNYNDIRKLAAGGVQPNLNLSIIKRTQFPFPDEKDMKRIIHEIESRLSVCDNIEETIAECLQQAEALRQSILKKAFEGKLVPQNPDDEPAAKLLERIRALRHSSAKLNAKARDRQNMKAAPEGRKVNSKRSSNPPDSSVGAEHKH